MPARRPGQMEYDPSDPYGQRAAAAASNTGRPPYGAPPAAAQHAYEQYQQQLQQLYSMPQTAHTQAKIADLNDKMRQMQAYCTPQQGFAPGDPRAAYAAYSSTMGAQPQTPKEESLPPYGSQAQQQQQQQQLLQNAQMHQQQGGPHPQSGYMAAAQGQATRSGAMVDEYGRPTSQMTSISSGMSPHGYPTGPQTQPASQPAADPYMMTPDDLMPSGEQTPAPSRGRGSRGRGRKKKERA